MGHLDDLLRGLLDDAALITADPEPGALVKRHRLLRQAHPDQVHSLLVTDRAAAQLDRILSGDDVTTPLPVTVLNTTGAGGLTSIAERTFAHLRVIAVDSPLRDPGDLIGNLLRVASAARQLDPEITVRVQIPAGIGWQDAIAEADAEGLQGHVDCRDTDRLAEQLSAHVEADLSFAADLPGTGVTAANLLTALDALIDGADPAEASVLLTEADHDRLVAAISSFDADRIGRIRRRLTGLRCVDVETVIDQLSR